MPRPAEPRGRGSRTLLADIVALTFAPTSRTLSVRQGEVLMRVKLTLALAFFACALTLPSAVSADISGVTITVNTTADSTGGPGCTLRDAITAANTDTVAGGCSAGHGADTIDFSVSGQINLGSTLPAVASDLAIDGSDQSIVVSGQGAVRVLEVSAGASLTLHRLTVADGDAANAGGVLNRGILVVTRSTLSGNKTTGFGNGGAIWNTAGATLMVRRSSFSDNGADWTLGAGIYNDGMALIRKSSFSDNNADHGGGIFNAAGGTLTIRGSTFSGNSAGEGGAIHNVAATAVSIANSSFLGNYASEGGGGAISNRDGTTLTVANSTFSGNGAPGAGGIASAGTLTVVRSTFSENIGDEGGAIAIFGTLRVADSTFSGNYARSGAGIDMIGSGTVRRSTFAGNRADDEGAGIDNKGGTLAVSNSTFAGNTTSIPYGGPGGAIANSGTLTLKSSTLFGNAAPEGAGIANDGSATLNNTMIAGSQGGNCSGTFDASSTSNLSDDPTCGPGFLQVGLADLNLGPLGDNGGPTQTIALGPGSVAIDAGDNTAAAGLITDQRGSGFPRIVNGRVDVGAFEVQQGPSQS
jgi:CSLREA domain-containing protein